MLHTSPPSVPSHAALTENPEAETRSFLDFFFTKQNRETDIRTTQKPTFRTPPTPLRHASTPLPIPQNGLSGSPQSPFHDAERAVSQRERASLAVPKSPSGNAGQYFPHCQKHHKESKPLNINNLEKPLKNRVFRIKRKSQSKQPILADIRQKTRACQATPQPHKNGFSHRTVTAFLKSIQACRTPVIRHKKQQGAGTSPCSLLLTIIPSPTELRLICRGARLIQSAFCGREHDVKPIHGDRSLSTFSHGNHACSLSFCCEAETFFSFSIYNFICYYSRFGLQNYSFLFKQPRRMRFLEDLFRFFSKINVTLQRIKEEQTNNSNLYKHI